MTDDRLFVKKKRNDNPDDKNVQFSYLFFKYAQLCVKLCKKYNKFNVEKSIRWYMAVFYLLIIILMVI